MTGILTPTFASVPVNAFRLRWRFEFSGNKRPAVGIYNGASDRQEDSAWAVSKEDMTYAIIEGENYLTQELVRLLECEASQYASMQWEAYSKSPSLGLKPEHGAFQLRPNIAGLSILTRTQTVTCWVDGTMTTTELSAHDKTWDIKEHSV